MLENIFLDKKIYSKYQEDLIQEEINAIQNENEFPPILSFHLYFDYRENDQCVITIENPNSKIFEKKAVDIYKKGKLIIKDAKVFAKSNYSAIL